MEIKDCYGKVLFTSKDATIKESLLAAIKSGANLSRANLYGANLSMANLYGADLYGANLSMANLYGAALSMANLSRANLYGANLSMANLYGADLYGANLSMANLSRADLYGATLSMANLYGADLYGANLYGANLSRANLSRANLSMANLSRADLYGADLYGANLSGAKNLHIPLACPEVGSFTAFKQCEDGKIVQLLIPEESKRSSSTGRKCRADKAVVLDIADNKGNSCKSAVSCWTSSFTYRVGETIEVKDFDDNRFQECAPGIHFFITRQEAIDY